MDVRTVLFIILAVFTGISAVAVVITQNIVRSAVWLLFTLAGVAGVFFLLGADFVASTQLIIYIGGILVLVVFGVMLTAQGPFINLRVGAAEWVVAASVGLLLFGVLAFTTLTGHWSQAPANPVPVPAFAENTEQPPAADSMNSTLLGMSFLGIEQITPRRDLTGLPSGVQARVRRPVAYLLPFEIVSVHLLVVLIGAAYLARAKRRRGMVS
jgi:NADH:ubiquinone oxidoreductase subunit 6 (subunit J)